MNNSNNRTKFAFGPYSYTFKDIYGAQKLAQKSLKSRWTIFMLIGIFVLLLFLMQVLNSHDFNVLLVFIILFFLLHDEIILRVNSYFIYKKNIKFYSAPTNFEFNENEINVVSDYAETNYKWRSFSKFVVNNKMLLLYIAAGIFVIVPKKALGSNDEIWDKIIALAKDKVIVK